ncbi:hypothetical protein NPX13_g1577 [Xylaria arbuscula]|uniref:Uncharacterized protein n=1 Tax=Xylaria arbuscula TaxID=114810 RepID=A0A9W8NLP9_9PEZI|nr:hypothetical protein NPX13_g1577 [Xylaria arbuscula]
MNNQPSQHRVCHGPSIPWDETMRIGPGGRHTAEFIRRINLPRVKRLDQGSGTIEDPKICWLLNPDYSVVEDVTKEEDKYQSVEAIVSEEASKRGMSHVWILMDSHATSTVNKIVCIDANKNERRVPTLSSDDNHITLRMGVRPDIANLHGHFYLIHEDNDCKKVAIRMMTEEERGVKGGKNPQLWVWPDYYDRSHIKYPKTPFEIKPGSILDRKQQEEAAKEAATRTRVQ